MPRYWDDYWRKFRSGERGVRRLELPGINRWFLLSILIIIGTVLIAYIGIKTGSYIEVLERNRTELLMNLTNCQNQLTILTDSLTTCNNNLESKSQALESCQQEKSTLSDSLDSCKEDLDVCKEDYDDLEIDYKECKDDLDDYKKDLKTCKSDLSDCKDDLNSCNDNYDSLNSAFGTVKENYAKDYCCLLNQTQGNITSWKYDSTSKKIVCTNSTSDNALTC